MSFFNELSKYEDNIAVVDENGCSVTYGQMETFAKKSGK